MSEQPPPEESGQGTKDALPALGDVFRGRSSVGTQPIVHQETPSDITFINRNRAKIVTPSPESSAPEILGQLDLPEPGAIILISGTGEKIEKDRLSRLQQLFSRGIARAAASKKAIIIDRGLHDGVVKLMGQGVADRERQSPLIGVPSKGKVASEFFGTAGEKLGQELDPNHSHFVLVEEQDWNIASKLMVELAAALADNRIIPPKPSPGPLESSEMSEDETDRSAGGEETDAIEGDVTDETADIGLDINEPQEAIAESVALEESEEDNQPGSDNASASNGQNPAEDVPDPVAQLAMKKPTLSILAGGSLDDKDPSKKEILFSVRKGWPIIILQGSGGLADEIFRLHNERQEAFKRAEIEASRDAAQAGERIRPEPIDDPDLAEIVVDGRLVFFAPDAESEELRELILRELPSPWAMDVLRLAWERFALYDKNAGRHKTEFNSLTVRILWLGVLTTLLAISITWLTLPGVPPLPDILLQYMRWGIIALPIVTSIMVAIFSRRKADTKWLLLRGSAEALKSKIYTYRALARTDPRNQLIDLQQSIEDLSWRLMQTEVNESALLKYDKKKIPPKMWGAADKDDGFSPLEPNQYIDIRIGDQISFYEGRTKDKEFFLRYYRVLILVLGGLGTFLAAVGLELWVALTTAAVTALTTYLLSEQFQETIIVYNQSQTDILNIKLWWETLSPSDKQKSENITRLVRTTEDALAREMRGWVQNMQNALSQLREDIREDQQSSTPS